MDKILGESLSSGYGMKGAHGKEGEIFYVYNRDDRGDDDPQWEKGKRYFAGTEEDKPYEAHALILGGMPSTEISAIVLRSPETSQEAAIEAVVNAGFYIPIYDMQGRLLLEPSGFDALLEKAKPYDTPEEFLNDTSYLDDLDQKQASSLHLYTLKDHLLRVTDIAQGVSDIMGTFNDKQKNTLLLAARLHDIGKRLDTVGDGQWFDNPTAAAAHLKKIKTLSNDDARDILYLIEHDELIGDILQGKKKPAELKQRFPSPKERDLLCALYLSDVLGIDEWASYRDWQVKEKIQSMGLSRFTNEQFSRFE